MTLEEYINQPNPKFGVRVWLDKSEVELFHLYTDVLGVKYYHISIPKIDQEYNIQTAYILKSNDVRLYTCDNEGNMRKASVFNLKVC